MKYWDFEKLRSALEGLENKSTIRLQVGGTILSIVGRKGKPKNREVEFRLAQEALRHSVFAAETDRGVLIFGHLGRNPRRPDQRPDFSKFVGGTPQRIIEGSVPSSWLRPALDEIKMFFGQETVREMGFFDGERPIETVGFFLKPLSWDAPGERRRPVFSEGSVAPHLKEWRRNPIPDTAAEDEIPENMAEPGDYVDPSDVPNQGISDIDM